MLQINTFTALIGMPLHLLYYFDFINLPSTPPHHIPRIASHLRTSTGKLTELLISPQLGLYIPIPSSKYVSMLPNKKMKHSHKSKSHQ